MYTSPYVTYRSPYPVTWPHFKLKAHYVDQGSRPN